MTTKRTALIILLALIATLAWLTRLLLQVRRREDALLLALDEAGAYRLGYTIGKSGAPGYWPEYPRTEYDVVPGVGRVWRASPAGSAYWAGWYLGEDESERANSS